jgi:hypothetical protein
MEAAIVTETWVPLDCILKTHFFSSCYCQAYVLINKYNDMLLGNRIMTEFQLLGFYVCKFSLAFFSFLFCALVFASDKNPENRQAMRLWWSYDIPKPVMCFETTLQTQYKLREFVSWHRYCHCGNQGQCCDLSVYWLPVVDAVRMVVVVVFINLGLDKMSSLLTVPCKMSGSCSNLLFCDIHFYILCISPEDNCLPVLKLCSKHQMLENFCCLYVVATTSLTCFLRNKFCFVHYPSLFPALLGCL